MTPDYKRPAESRWTRAQIRDARLAPLGPLLEQRGLHLVETGGGNLAVTVRGRPRTITFIGCFNPLRIDPHCARARLRNGSLAVSRFRVGMRYTAICGVESV